MQQAGEVFPGLQFLTVALAKPGRRAEAKQVLRQAGLFRQRQQFKLLPSSQTIQLEIRRADLTPAAGGRQVGGEFLRANWPGWKRPAWVIKKISGIGRFRPAAPMRTGAP